jgi:superkiller protein 3
MINRPGNLRFVLVTAIALGLMVVSVGSLFAASDKAKEFFNQGVTASKAGKTDDAIAAYKQAIDADASYFDAYMNLGALQFQKGLYDDALKSFRSASEKDPKSVDALVNIAQVEYKKRAYIESEAAYKSAISLEPTNAKLQRALANVYFSRGGWNELAQTAEKLHQMNSADDTTWYWLGKALEKQDKTPDAIAAYEKSIAMKAKNYRANFAIGQIYLQQEKFEQAAKYFKAAMTADPKGYRAAYNYAVAMETLKQDAIAANIANWQDFVRIARNIPQAKNDVAIAQSHIKDLQDAKAKAGQ